MWGKLLSVVLAMGFAPYLAASLPPIQIVTEVPDAHCEEKDFQKDVRLFNYEAKLFTTFRGKTNLMITGVPRSIGPVAFEVPRREPKASRYFQSNPMYRQHDVMALPVKVCAPSNGYTDAMGFVLVSEWDEALRASDAAGEQGLPPSTKANQIPQRTGARTEVTIPLF